MEEEEWSQVFARYCDAATPVYAANGGRKDLRVQSHRLQWSSPYE